MTINTPDELAEAVQKLTNETITLWNKNPITVVEATLTLLIAVHMEALHPAERERALARMIGAGKTALDLIEQHPRLN